MFRYGGGISGRERPASGFGRRRRLRIQPNSLWPTRFRIQNGLCTATRHWHGTQWPGHWHGVQRPRVRDGTQRHRYRRNIDGATAKPRPELHAATGHWFWPQWKRRRHGGQRRRGRHGSQRRRRGDGTQRHRHRRDITGASAKLRRARPPLKKRDSSPRYRCEEEMRFARLPAWNRNHASITAAYCLKMPAPRLIQLSGIRPGARFPSCERCAACVSVAASTPVERKDLRFPGGWREAHERRKLMPSCCLARRRIACPPFGLATDFLQGACR